MNEKLTAQVQRLEDSGYLNQIREFAMARSAPFFWSRQPPNQDPELLHNGTITYVATGQKELGVTNVHVYNQYLADRANGPDVEAQFESSTIYPEQRLVDLSNELDLATLDVPKIFLESSFAGKLHNRPETWPPEPLRAGELVIYGGYPDELKEPGTNKIV